jgi:hypothetical protein
MDNDRYEEVQSRADEHDDDDDDDGEYAVSEEDSYKFGRVVDDGLLPFTQQRLEQDGIGDCHTSTTRSRYADAEMMPDFNDTHLGVGIHPRVPHFENDYTNNNSIWTCCDKMHGTIRPVRAMVVNIPVSLIAHDAVRFCDWQTPKNNASRAVSIAALVGMMWSGTSRGYITGNHEEIARETNTDNKMKRAFRYSFMDCSDNNEPAPMFLLAYEEIYDKACDDVVALRIWKLVFDDQHSDSHLWKKLMSESQETFLAAGFAHTSSRFRNKTLVAEQKHVRAITGLQSRADLEYNAGTQFVHIQNECRLLDALRAYGGGIGTGCVGRDCVDMKRIPRRATMKRVEGHYDGKGGIHVLSPEYALNAKRVMALSAGLVYIGDSSLMDVNPSQIDPAMYFAADGSMTFPRIVQEKKCMWICHDISVTNIFPVALPRKIFGNVMPGPALLDMYEEMYTNTHGVNSASEMFASSDGRANVAEMFDNFVTETDQKIVEMEKRAVLTVLSNDSIDLDPVQRKGIRYYGAKEKSGAYIVEPRQILKEIQIQTNRIHAKIVCPWLKKREVLHDENDVLSDVDSTPTHSSPFRDGVTRISSMRYETQDKHADVMRDIIMLHLNKLFDTFQNEGERGTIPEGYRCMYDGLQTELDKTPNRTASVAFAYDNSVTADDVTVFGHLWLWLGNFWEHDCFIKGRDRRIMDEIFLHMFEQYSPQTFVLVLPGVKGNGKSMRCKRAVRSFPKGWADFGGPRSSKSGMNGQSDSNDGKNIFYDEMLHELTTAEGSAEIEYWKEILMNKCCTYNRTVTMKSEDGSEEYRSMKLRTPHNETHCMCVCHAPPYVLCNDF